MLVMLWCERAITMDERGYDGGAPGGGISSDECRLQLHTVDGGSTQAKTRICVVSPHALGRVGEGPRVRTDSTRRMCKTGETPGKAPGSAPRVASGARACAFGDRSISGAYIKYNVHKILFKVEPNPTPKRPGAGARRKPRAGANRTRSESARLLTRECTPDHRGDLI